MRGKPEASGTGGRGRTLTFSKGRRRPPRGKEVRARTCRTGRRPRRPGESAPAATGRPPPAWTLVGSVAVEWAQEAGVGSRRWLAHAGPGGPPRTPAFPLRETRTAGGFPRGESGDLTDPFNDRACPEVAPAGGRGPVRSQGGDHPPARTSDERTSDGARGWAAAQEVARPVRTGVFQVEPI